MKQIIISAYFFLMAAVSLAQQQQVTGYVKDIAGEPVVGANVVVKGGANVGAITDYDGKFVVEAPLNRTLIISYIGFITKEVEASGRASINVVLVEDNLALDEVVVIGYGSQRKGDVTSAVGSVKRENFAAGTIKDAGQLIQGRIAGLTVTNSSGNPVAGTAVSLRGNTTVFGTSTQPLILVDGVPGDFSTVAPEDIESVDVLKDGSAAAIYGTRGTNGVILITTRKAKGDNINLVEYHSYLSTSTIARRLEMSTAADYRQQIKDGIRDAAWDLGHSTDWMDEIMRTPLSHVHNLSFKGGNVNTNYVMNLNFRSLQGIMKRSDKEEFQGRAEINHNMLDEKVKINFTIIGNKTGYTSTADGGSFNNYVFRQALIHNPTETVKNADGSWYENTGIFEYDNPLGRLYESDGMQDITQLRFNGNATVNPIKNLTLKALFSYDKTHRNGGYYETKNHVSTLRDNRNGYAAVGGSSNLTKLMELTAQYAGTKGDHNFSLLGGYSYQGTDYSNQYEQNWDFPTDLYSYNNIGTGAALKEGLAVQFSDRLKTNLVGFFGRMSYAYKNRYLLMAAIRHEEGSQLAGTNNEWGTFPSVSLGWRVTEESFMQGQSIFDDLKLRAGYGVTGSLPGSSFLGVSMLGYDAYFYYDGKWIQSLKPVQNANPDLKWEEKRETNIGLDFSILNGRISGSVDRYVRNIHDLLYDYAVPSPPNLYNTTRANVGKMSNTGWEAAVSFIPVQSQSATWSSTLTFSTNSNKLESLSNDLYQASSDYFMTGWIQEPVKIESHIVKVGEPIGNFYGFKVVDVDEQGKWIYEDKDGNATPYDLFGHSFEDKKVIGNGLPKFHLGWTNGVRYKSWDAAVSMRGAFGFQIINVARMFYENRSRQDWNRLKSAYQPVFGKAQLSSLCAEEYNSYYVEDGDYWKIDNLSVGYNFRSIGKYIKGMRLYLSGQNLVTFTGYKGVDPEVSVSGLNPGYDNRDQYPNVRSFTIGLNIIF